MSSIRYDRIHDTHVIIAPERLYRPDCSFGADEPQSVEPDCAFCEGNESMTPPEIFATRKPQTLANTAGWQTRVVPNLYKAVQIEAPYAHHYGLFEYHEGFGAHEVIIDTPEHLTSMTQWNAQTAVQWLKTLRARVHDLRRDQRMAYISVFKNEGILAGATQTHSHTQMIGLPFVPKVARENYRRSYEHYKQHGISLLQSCVQHEEEQQERVIAKHGDFTAFCPFASAYAFEVMITSQKALGQIDTLSDESINTLAPLLLATLRVLKAQLVCFAFNLVITTPPLQEGSADYGMLSCVDEACRFAVRIMPRIYKHGGFEVGTGVYINPVLPEVAAKLLREGIDV